MNVDLGAVGKDDRTPHPESPLYTSLPAALFAKNCSAPSVELTAVHDAGHVVVALALGSQVGRAAPWTPDRARRMPLTIGECVPHVVVPSNNDMRRRFASSGCQTRANAA